MQLRPVLAAQGDACQLQHIQHVGVAQLILQRKADEVEIADRVAAFQGIEGDVLPAHFLLHVHPGGKHPLTPKIRDLIHGAVEDFNAQVGHADFVGIGEAEGKAHLHLGGVLHHRVELAAHIPAGFLDLLQRVFQFLVVSHSYLSNLKRLNAQWMNMASPKLKNRYFSCTATL